MPVVFPHSTSRNVVRQPDPEPLTRWNSYLWYAGPAQLPTGTGCAAGGGAVPTARGDGFDSSETR